MPTMTAITSLPQNPHTLSDQEMAQTYIDAIKQSANKPATIVDEIKIALQQAKNILPTLLLEHRSVYCSQFIHMLLDKIPTTEEWIRNKTFQTLWELLYKDLELLECARAFSLYLINTTDTEHFCYSNKFTSTQIHYFLKSNWENCIQTGSPSNLVSCYELSLISELAYLSIKSDSLLDNIPFLKTTESVKFFIASFLKDPENFENKPRTGLFITEFKILYCFLRLMTNKPPIIPIPYILAPYWTQQQLERQINTLSAPSLAPATIPSIQIAATVAASIPQIQAAAIPPQPRIQPMPKKPASTPSIPPKAKQTKKRPQESKTPSPLQPQLKKAALNTQPVPGQSPSLLLGFIPAMTEQFLIARDKEFETFLKNNFLQRAPTLSSEEEGRTFWLRLFDGVWNYQEQTHEDSENLFETVYENIFLCFDALQSKRDNFLIYTFCDVVITLFQETELFDEGSPTDRKVRAAFWSECWVSIVDRFKVECPSTLLQFQIWMIALRQRWKYEQIITKKKLKIFLAQDKKTIRNYFRTNQPANASEFPYWLAINWYDERLDYLPDNIAIERELIDFLANKRPQREFSEHFPLLDDYCALSDKTTPLKPVPFIFWNQVISKIPPRYIKHNIFHTLAQELDSDIRISETSYETLDRYDLMDPKPLIRMIVAKLFHPDNGIPYEKIQRDLEHTVGIEKLFKQLFETYFLPNYDDYLKTNYQDFIDYVCPKIEKFWIGLTDGILEHREYARCYIEALMAYLSKINGRLFIMETFMKASMPMLLKSGIFEKETKTEADAYFKEVMFYFVKGNFGETLRLLNNVENQDKRYLQTWIILQHITNQFDEDSYIKYSWGLGINESESRDCLEAYRFFQKKDTSLSKQWLVSSYPILYSYFFHCKIHNTFDTKRPIVPMLARLWITERIHANANDPKKSLYVNYLKQAVEAVENFDRWQPVVKNKKEKQSDV